MVRQAADRGFGKKLTWLARAMRHHRAALRADFRRYYALCLDDMGRAYSISEAADLAAMLPPDSRTFVEDDPVNAWTLEAALLARCANELALLRWFGSEDGAKGRNRPEPIAPPTRGEASAKQSRYEPRTIEEIDELFKKKRKEVRNGN